MMFPLLAIFDKNEKVVVAYNDDDREIVEKRCIREEGERVVSITGIKNTPTSFCPPVTICRLEAWGNEIYEIYDTDGERYLFSVDSYSKAQELANLINTRIYCRLMTTEEVDARNSDL